MKKIYAALAMALAASPAFAARVNTEAMPLNLPAEVSNFSKVAETRGDVMKELSITSVDQLCGPWMFEFSSGFDEDEHNVTVYIEKGASANQVVIYGLMQRTNFACGFGVVGNVDLNKSTITIPEQVLVPADEWDGNALKYIPMNAQTGKRTNGTVLTICPQGITINGKPAFEEGCIASLGPEAGFFATDPGFEENRGYALFYNAVITDVKAYGDDTQQFFTYNPSEWKDWGYAKFTDGFLNELFEPVDAYEVRLQKKADDTDEYLLVGPYTTNSPYGLVNENSSKQGYLYINATDPDCVLVRPGVNPEYNDQYTLPFGPLYFCNNEGLLYYMDEYSIDEIKEEYGFYGDKLSNMTVNNGQVTIEILKGKVATCCDLYSYGLYPVTGEAIGCGDSKITFAYDGIESVASDIDEVAPRYFNLQGMEVVNPAAGDIVIVKKGNKAYKQVVR